MFIKRSLHGILIVLVCALAVNSGCKATAKININDEDRDKILAELRHAVDTLDKAVADLQETFDEQRAKLALDVQQSVGMAIVNLRGVVDQLYKSVEVMDVQITNLRQAFTADVRAALVTLGTLTQQLENGVHAATADTIARVASEIERQSTATLGQVHQLVQTAIRPTLAQLREEAGFLVGKVTIEANVIVVRLVSGGVALIAVIGMILALLKLHGASRRWPAVSITGLVFLGGALSGTAFARPLSRVGQEEVRIPKGEVICSQMSAKGRELVESIGDRVPRSDVGRSVPVPTALLGAARRVPPAHATSPGPAAARAGAGDLAALAEEVRSMASECQLRAPTLEWADLGRVYFVRASAYLGEPVRCYTHADCTALSQACAAGGPDCHPFRCDTSTGECLRLGVYCEGQTDCAPGDQCNMQHRRCVPRDTGECSTPEDCRPEDSCDKAKGRCVSTDAVNASAVPCEVTTAGVLGPCRQGAWRSVDRWVQCVATVQASPEACDGVDNDCNGTVDDGVQRADHCLPSGAQGECAALSRWRCDGAAGWTCVAAEPQAETCDGKDNDCDGTVDDDIPGGGSCTAGLGECAVRATWLCQGGVMQCVPGQPAPERCGDGKDNDCNGQTDESSCSPPPCPPCPQGQHCAGGRCVPDQSEGECDEGDTDYRGSCRIGNRIGTQEWRCRSGRWTRSRCVSDIP